MSELITNTAFILILLIIIGISSAYICLKTLKEGKYVKQNYYVFFIIGMIWLPTGLIYMIATMTLSYGVPLLLGIPLFSMGLIFLIISSANRDKWINF
ncbi:MAG: hypothetical protein JSU91_05870 [Thermoplasmatales archaeon]|nr:MAG: hypothetical protein JSU91_05870 [Thermoplasmatales archaeon]